MHRLDTSDRPRLAALQRLLNRVSASDEPIELLDQLTAGLEQFVPFDAILTLSSWDLAGGEYKITRLSLTGSDSWPGDPWSEWERLPVHRGGFLGDLIHTPSPAIVGDLFLRNDPALGDQLADFGSCLAVPIFDGREALNWCLLFRLDANGFSADDLEIALLLTNLVGRTMHHLITRRELERLNRRITQQLEQVAAIQRALLPQELPSIPGLDVARFYRPSEHAGGDYYDFVPVDRDGRWAIVIGDVSGHGASAAVIMAMLETLIHSFAEGFARPDRLLMHVNRFLVRERIEQGFVTAFAAVVDPRERSLAYACAGHPPPRIKMARRDSDVRSLPLEASPPLGILTDYRIAQSHARFGAGDTLVLYTDGVIESFNARREMFGIERFDAAIREADGGSANVIDRITADMRQHAGDRPPADDQTILAIRFTP